MSLDKSAVHSAVAVPAVQPDLTHIQKAVLRWVTCGDAFRDKGRGVTGRRARIDTLLRLEEKGLLRQNRDGLWKVTASGRIVLRALAAKKR
jgi:hypothetical protein